MKRLLKPVFEAPPAGPDHESSKDNGEQTARNAEPTKWNVEPAATAQKSVDEQISEAPRQSFAVNGVRDFFTYEEWVRLNEYLKVNVGLEAGPQFAPGLDSEGRDVAVLLQRLAKLVPTVNQRSPPDTKQPRPVSRNHFTPSGEFQSLSLQR